MKHYIRILQAHPRPIRLILARGLAISGLCRRLTIKQQGYRLRFHRSNLAEQLWINPLCREDALEFFRAYLKPGDKVIDVGANIGDTVLTAAVNVGATGRVWAVEPHPRTFRFLEANLKLNGLTNVEAINSAAGDTLGEVTFSDGRRDDMNRVGGGMLRVPIHRLDDLVACCDPIALLKVDVEGYEKPVFLGAPAILEKTQYLHFEVSRTHFSWFGYQIRDLLRLLESLDFKLFRIESNGTLQRIDVDFETDKVENLIGLRSATEFVERTGWEIAS
jgi:FkbM family methyltransferase